jgi:hypothetical protein
MTFRYRNSRYHISVEAAFGATREAELVELDGSPLPDGRVPLVNDGKTHEVRLLMR